MSCAELYLRGPLRGEVRILKFLIFLLCSLVVFGQNTAPSPEPNAQSGANSADPKNRNHEFSLGMGEHRDQQENVEILSDTKGLDFRPYLKVALREVRENWYRLITPCAARMKGKVAIEFAITKDGHVAALRLVTSSQTAALDRAAWGSITASNPFLPLPGEFTGQYLALRLRFSYNPGSTGPESSGLACSDSTKVDWAESHTKSRSGMSVIVTAPLSGDLNVPLGGSKLVKAMVTGSGSKDGAVEWRISGLGCSGSSCGEISQDSYHAPSVMPSTSFVTLTAVAKADASAKASITLHIVDSNPSH